MAQQEKTCNLAGIATMVLPRMEIDFIFEWLAHHASLGISHFWIFDDGHQAHDNNFPYQGDERIWGKKPNADFHLELSDTEIDQRFSEIIEKSRDLLKVSIKTIHVSSRGKNVGKRQIDSVNSILSEAKEDVEWLGFIDIDEFLVGSLDYLRGIPSRYSEVRMKQKLFGERWTSEGFPIPAEQNTTHYGALGFNGKSFGRLHHLGAWSHPHRIYPKHRRGAFIGAPFHQLRFHHFRGNASPPVNANRDALPTYAKQRVKGEDNSHSRTFGIIVGTMRSGSSLFCHLINEARLGHVAGETHRTYDNDEKISKSKNQIINTLDVKTPYLPIYDKILHKEHFGNLQLLRSHLCEIMVLTRHPLATWNSLRKTNWKQANHRYLIRQLKSIEWWIMNCENVPLRFFDYYDLLDPNKRFSLLGKDVATYQKIKTTGKPGWGDPGKLIGEGKVIHRTKEQDLDKALIELGSIPDGLKPALELHWRIKAYSNCFYSSDPEDLSTRIVETPPKDVDFTYWDSSNNLENELQQHAMTQLVGPETHKHPRNSLRNSNTDGKLIISYGYIGTSNQIGRDNANYRFIGTYLPSAPSNELLNWLRKSDRPVGVRDPTTLKNLLDTGIQAQLTYGPNVTLPPFSGPRRGKFVINARSFPLKSYDWNLINLNLEYHEARHREKRLNLAYSVFLSCRQAEYVVTSSIEILFLCLASGTPVWVHSSEEQPSQYLEEMLMHLSLTSNCWIKDFDTTSLRKSFFSYLSLQINESGQKFDS